MRLCRSLIIFNMDNTKNNSDANKVNDTEKLSETKTTGSGITELDHDTLDGNNSETPFDPKHPDFPGNDKVH